MTPTMRHPDIEHLTCVKHRTISPDACRTGDRTSAQGRTPVPLLSHTDIAPEMAAITQKQKKPTV